MAEKVKFQPQKFDINSINNGNKFTLSDGIAPEAVNAPIESAAYMQALATNQPDNSEAGLIGQPNVSIEQAEDGTPRFKFSNLKAPDHLEKIEQIEKQTNDNSQQLNNLNAALLQNEILTMVEVEQAFVSRETADGESIVDEQNVFPKLIKGSTVKSANLIPFPYVGNITGTGTSWTNNGITFTVQADGGIKIQGTRETASYLSVNIGNAMFKDKFPDMNIYAFSPKTSSTKNGYTISFGITGTVDGVDAHETNLITVASTADVNKTWVRLGEVIATYDCVVYPMFNEGSTALPFRPYFSGLKNAYLQSIKSTGRNLLDCDEIINFTVYSPQKQFYISAGDYTLSWQSYTQGGAEAPVIVLVHESGKEYALSCYNGFNTFNLIEGNYTLRCYSNGYSYQNSVNTTSIIKGIMLNHGTTALPYEPYTEETYQLPQTLELGEWDSYNPQTGELTVGTKTIAFDGTEAWGIATGATYPRIFTHVANAVDSEKDSMAIVCNHYKWGNAGYVGRACIVIDSTSNLVVEDSRFTTVEQWKAQLAEWKSAGNPLTVAYKSATPTTETIAHAPKLYKAYNHGSETVNQGETDNSEYGAMCTLTNDYFVKIGGATNEQTE